MRAWRVEGGRRRREESSLTIFAGVVLTVFCASANFEACRPGNFREIFITWNRIYTMDVSRVLWMERDTRFLIFRKNFFFFISRNCILDNSIVKIFFILLDSRMILEMIFSHFGLKNHSYILTTPCVIQAFPNLRRKREREDDSFYFFLSSFIFSSILYFENSSSKEYFIAAILTNESKPIRTTANLNILISSFSFSQSNLPIIQ